MERQIQGDFEMPDINTWLRFLKFEHSMLALPFIYAGAILAYGQGHSLNLAVLALITLAATGARTCAMSLNRLIDRKIDALNPRTNRRAMPLGLITRNDAALLAIAGFILLIACSAMLNPLCLALSPLILPPLVLYPYLKRYTHLSHLFLGAILALGPIGGYLAVIGTLDLPNMTGALVLAGGMMMWVSGFDVQYAIKDMRFDREHGLHSIPARFGRKRALFTSLLMHLTFLISLLFLHLWMNFTPFLLIIPTTIGFILALEQKTPGHKKLCSKENGLFANNMIIGWLVLLWLYLGTTL